LGDVDSEEPVLLESGEEYEIEKIINKRVSRNKV
jgi:hypothetical protein